MNLFNKFKNNNGNKKYMKYEDGKIVPVEVDEPIEMNEKTESRTISESINTQELKTVIKEKIEVTNPISKYGMTKTIKVVGAIAIVVFFIFTVRDFYVAFSDDENTDVVTNANTEVSNHVSKKNEESLSNNLLFVEQEKDLSQLELVINSANLIEKQMIDKMNEDISLTLSYLKNRVNKNVFDTKLATSIEGKNSLLGLLVQREVLFEDVEALDYYDVLNKRILNTLDLVQYVSNSYPESDDNMIKELNQFIKIENELKNEQNKIFVNLLDDNNISYTIDKDTNKIIYELK